ncbi:hypothetical protein [Actinomadura sp. B10D3]|uniref:hypothetical protein n=1 Tax=Actinomadura sp. B10D3 TaxID=3153557 RepID=UPI00325D8731
MLAAVDLHAPRDLAVSAVDRLERAASARASCRSTRELDQVAAEAKPQVVVFPSALCRYRLDRLAVNAQGGAKVDTASVRVAVI